MVAVGRKNQEDIQFAVNGEITTSGGIAIGEREDSSYAPTPHNRRREQFLQLLVVFTKKFPLNSSRGSIRFIMMNSISFSRNIVRIGCLLLLCGAMIGCVNRRLTIRSDPPGALVRIDGKNVGFTPLSMDFDYYGTREITLIKDGYETLTVQQEVAAPLYQRFPLDAVSDNFLPFRVTNRHDFRYSLQRQKIIPENEIIDRANDLRSNALLGN